MSNYRIILRGVKPGQSIDEAVNALARYSKKTPDKLRALLASGKHMVAKRTEIAQQATHYKLLLDKLGFDCIIEAEITERVDDSPNNTSVLVTDIAESPHQGTSRRGVTYRQKTRSQELMDSITQIFRPRTVLGLIVLAILLYFGWQQLNS